LIKKKNLLKILLCRTILIANIERKKKLLFMSSFKDDKELNYKLPFKITFSLDINTTHAPTLSARSKERVRL